MFKISSLAFLVSLFSIELFAAGDKEENNTSSTCTSTSSGFLDAYSASVRRLDALINSLRNNQTSAQEREEIIQLATGLFFSSEKEEEMIEKIRSSQLTEGERDEIIKSLESLKFAKDRTLLQIMQNNDYPNNEHFNRALELCLTILPPELKMIIVYEKAFCFSDTNCDADLDDERSRILPVKLETIHQTVLFCVKEFLAKLKGKEKKAYFMVKTLLEKLISAPEEKVLNERIPIDVVEKILDFLSCSVDVSNFKKFIECKKIAPVDGEIISISDNELRLIRISELRLHFINVVYFNSLIYKEMRTLLNSQFYSEPSMPLSMNGFFSPTDTLFTRVCGVIYPRERSDSFLSDLERNLFPRVSAVIDDYAELRRALISNTTLDQLSLWEPLNNAATNIGVDYARALGDGLAGNTCLRILDLQRTNMTNEAILALAEGLARNNILEELDLSFNPLNGQGIIDFLEALEENNALKKLVLLGMDNTIGEALKATILRIGNQRNIEVKFT